MSRCFLIIPLIRRETASSLRRASLTCQGVCQGEDGATATSISSPTREATCVHASLRNGDQEGFEVGLTDGGVVDSRSSLSDGMAVTNLPSIAWQRMIGELRSGDSLTGRAVTRVAGPQGAGATWGPGFACISGRVRGAEARKPCRPRLVSLVSLRERGQAVWCLLDGGPPARRSHRPGA
jgi:hypothetical protein